MATWLKQSTAIDVKVGPFVDESDGKTAETGLTITQPDIRLAKNGGAFAQKNAAQTLTHEENGWYEVALDTTDTNTLGTLILAIHESGALPVWREFLVLPANVYDSFLSTDLLQVDTREVGGTTQTAGDIMADTNDIQTRLPAALVSGRMDSSVGAMAANTITAAATAADFSTEVNAGVLAVLGALNDAAVDGDPTTTDTVVQYLKQLVNVLVGSAGVATFPASATPANAVSLAEVIRQIYDEVAGLNGGALPAAAPTAAQVADAVWTETLADHSGVSGSTAEALNAAGAAGDPWTTALPGAYGAGSAGAIIGALDDSVAAIEADTQDIQNRLPAALVSGRIDASVGAMAANVVTASAIATDAIGAAEIADGAITAATFAAGAIDATAIATDAITAAKIAANAIGSSEIADGAITAAKIATDAIDADALADGAITSGVFAAGAITASAIAADAIGASELAADAVTEIQSGLATAAALTTIDDFLDTEVAAIKAVTDKLDTALELDGAVYRYTTNALEQSPAGGGGGATAADIWAYVTRTLTSSPGGLPGSGAIQFTYTVYRPDGTTPIDGAEVWVTTDIAGTNVVAGTLNTAMNGQVQFMLDAGVYYFWRKAAGWHFVNPDTETVS